MVVASDPTPVTEPVDAHVSLHSGPLERLNGSRSWCACWVVAELSHPASCSVRWLSARATFVGGHALDVVEGLTVRTQRVLKRFRSAIIAEVASSLASLQVTEEGGFRPPANITRSMMFWIRPVPLLVCLLLWSW